MVEVAVLIGTMLIAGTFGMLLLVNVFRLVAGVTFGTWRHIVAAYLAGTFAAVFFSAASAASGGPPNFSMAPFQLAGALIAALLEWLLIKKRQVAV